MVDDRDIYKVVTYMHNMKPLKSKATDECIQCSAYEEWAVTEILSRLTDEMVTLPSHITGYEPVSAGEIVEQFIQEMEYCRSISTNRDAILMYSIAIDEGFNIRKLFEHEGVF